MKIRNNRLLNRILSVYANRLCNHNDHYELRYCGYCDLLDQEANDYVYELLASGQPAMISKFGSVELSNLVARHIDETTGLTKEIINDYLHYNNVTITIREHLRICVQMPAFFLMI